MIREIIYFDTEKITSIISQVQAGVVRETSETSEEASEKSSGGSLGVSATKGEHSQGSSEKTSRTENRVPYHSLLATLINILTNRGLLFSINPEVVPDELDNMRENIRKSSFTSCSGFINLEDNRELLDFASGFNSLIDFIGYCSLTGTLGLDPENVANYMKKKKSARAKDKKIHNQLAALGIGQIPDYFVETMPAFLRKFYPDILMKLQPCVGIDGFQVRASMKPTSFTDDAETIIHAYGERPNFEFTMVGIVSSVEPKDGSVGLDPRVKLDIGQAAEIEIEDAWINMTSSFYDIRRFFRLYPYPHVGLVPLAVFRDLSH